MKWVKKGSLESIQRLTEESELPFFSALNVKASSCFACSVHTWLQCNTLGRRSLIHLGDFEKASFVPSSLQAATMSALAICIFSWQRPSPPGLLPSENLTYGRVHKECICRQHEENCLQGQILAILTPEQLALLHFFAPHVVCAHTENKLLKSRHSHLKLPLF